MNEEILSALAAEYGGEEYEASSKTVHQNKLNLQWKPRLNPTQEKVYACRAPYGLIFGPRGSGKTQVGLHALVRHAVFNRNALCFVITREAGNATEGGAWESLVTEILPQWKNGNYDRKANRFIDSGCGIEFTVPKLDALDKKPTLFVANRYNGFSMIKLLSMNVGHAVEDKVKGKTPSFILVDEAQTFDTADIRTKLGQQVGRRQGIEDAQQILYLCNPKGPSHFLYKEFFCAGFDEAGNPIECSIDAVTGHPIHPDTGDPIKDRVVFFVPTQENLHNLPDGYWNRVIEATRNDPIEYARMVEGQWVDKPEGAAIFKDVWDDKAHMVGDAFKDKGLIPIPESDLGSVVTKHWVIVGWDPGTAHTSIHFMQFFNVNGKPPTTEWNVFDEFNTVGKYMSYKELVPKIVQRMVYWEHAAREQFDKPVEFKFVHISDSSAFNQFRAKDGSFDAQDIEEISKQYVERHGLPERFIIRMRACPKGPDTVAARVRLTMDVLAEKRIHVSATCIKTREMFMNLEAEKDDRLKPKRSIHIHPFDSLSYPLFYYNSGAGKSVAKVRKQEIPSQIYRI